MKKNAVQIAPLLLRLLLLLNLLIAAMEAQAGFVVRLRYADSTVGGARTTNYRDLLANSALFPGAPTSSETLSDRLATAINFGDDYGSLIRGYIVAPEDGSYTFTVASDDSSGLWITNAAVVPANFPTQSPSAPRAPDGEETGWSSQGIFGALRLAERTSEPFNLRKGDTLYFEIVSQEGGGGDFAQLGWTRPSGIREIIPGLHLLPWTPATNTLAFANGETNGVDSVNPVSGPADMTVAELHPATFKVDVWGGRRPLTFQWKKNGAAIPEGTLPSFTIPSTALAQSGERYECEVTDADGNKITSRSATLTVQADTQGPRLLGARGSGYPAGIIVTFSEDVDPATATNKANYQLTGQTVTVDSVTLLGPSQALLRVSTYNTDPLVLAVSNVKDLSAAGNAVAANSTNLVALRSTLAAYWTFDENRGETALDAAGGFHGMFVNEPVWTNDAPSLGRFNRSALSFDGANDYLQTTYPGVGGTRPRTVAFWMKSTLVPPNTHGIIAWGNSTANSLKYHVRLETSTGSIRTEAQGGNIWGTAPLNDGNWHHVVSMLPSGVVPENGSVRHFVDGVLDPPLSTSAVAINTDITSVSAVPVRIGGRDQAGAVQSFPGLVDEVAIYDGDLTPEQIAQLAKGADPFLFGKTLAAAITVTNQPADVVVSEVDTPTFSVGASGSPVIGYQWFKNGQPIAGAQGASYTTPPVTPQDNQSKYHVEVFNLDGSFNRIVSRTATLAVSTDRSPPAIVSIRGAGSGINRVVIQFDEPLDPATATNASTFRIDSVTINGLALDSTNSRVTLSTSALTDGNTYTLSITGLKDAAIAGNQLTTNATFKPFATFPDQVLADGPVRYWRFEERAGATSILSERSVRDSLATATIVNIQGGPNHDAESLLANDRESNAIGFDRSRALQVLIAPNGNDINTSVGPWAKRTIEFWFLAKSLPSTDLTGVNRGWGLYEEGGGDRGISVYLYGAQPGSTPAEANLVFSGVNRLDDGAGAPWGDPANPDTVATVEFPVKANQAYHVVAVMDGDGSDAVDPTSGKLVGSLKLYVDGKLVDETPGVGQLYNHTSDIQIGRGNFRDHANTSGAHGWFDGTIDELALYNQALPPDRVKAHFDAAFAGLETGQPRFTKHPVDTTATELGQASFSAEFTGTAPLAAQWFLNNQPIPGAVTAAGVSTVTFTARAADDGAKVKVQVTNDLGVATSTEATLTVTRDATAPALTGVEGGAGQANYVFVRFNENVDPVSAQVSSNYTVNGLAVLSATLNTDGREVILRTAQQTSGATYNLQISGVKDLSAAGNPVNLSTNFVSQLSYRVEVLSDQPDIYFTFAETNGVIARDIMRRDTNYVADYLALATGGSLPQLGADRLVPGAPDRAVGFAASSFNIARFVGDTRFVNTGGPYEEKTIELWFKANRLPRLPAGAAAEKMVLWEQGGLTRGISIYLAGTQDAANPGQADLYFHAWNDASDPVGAPWGGPAEETKTPIFVKASVQTNKTYHAVMVLDGDGTGTFTGRIDAYLDGQLLPAAGGQNQGVGLLYSHGDNAALGGAHQNAVYHDLNRTVADGDFFDGILDEFAVYNKALTAARIQTHYNQGLVRVPLDGELEDIRITSIRASGGNVTISWTGGGQLQKADAVTGPYSTVAGSASPFTEAAAAQAKFYRVTR